MENELSVMESGILHDIERLVCVESPSNDPDALRRAAQVVADMGEGYLGVPPERLERDGPVHLRWEFGDPADRRVLVLCHYDTVWPMGTLESRPFSIADGILRGPGCFDMKSGIVMAFHAIAALDDRTGVTLLVTGDEEIGSPSSRELIEEEARRSEACLVLEAAGPGGTIKTARKGISLYEVRLRGRAAHAGLEPERGVNASLEAARQLLAVAALSAPEIGTTVTPTVVQCGTTSNTVPAEGRFSVDVRVCDAAEQTRIDRELKSLTAQLPGAAVEVTGGPNRPPLQTDMTRALFDRACRIADSLGVGPLEGMAVGGASDGNFAGGVGTPTLDGLGAVGGGAHADDEHVLVAELPGRIRLLHALIAELQAESAPVASALGATARQVEP